MRKNHLKRENVALLLGLLAAAFVVLVIAIVTASSDVRGALIGTRSQQTTTSRQVTKPMTPAPSCSERCTRNLAACLQSGEGADVCGQSFDRCTSACPLPRR